VLGYVIRRTAWAGVLFLVLTAFTFVIFFVVPGAGRQVQSFRRGSELRLRDEVKLQGSIAHQYAGFVKAVVTHGSLGHSYYNRHPVNELVFKSAQVTAALVLGGMLFWMAIAIPIGILSALRPRSLLDRGGMVFVLIGLSCHPIWLGSILLYTFSFRLGWLPSGGYCTVLQTTGGCFGPRQWALHLILPWIAYGMLFAALYTRMIRSFTIEALREDHVTTARAKGASEFHVIRRHVLRHVALPVVTMLGMDLGIFLTSAVFVETVFGLPGIGTLLVNATIRLDLPVLVGVTVFVTVVVLAFNLVVDLVYALLDPRVRTYQPRQRSRRRRQFLRRPRTRTAYASQSAQARS
jgi:peptide/nickel transport system permease protein